MFIYDKIIKINGKAHAALCHFTFFKIAIGYARLYILEQSKNAFFQAVYHSVSRWMDWKSEMPWNDKGYLNESGRPASAIQSPKDWKN